MTRYWLCGLLLIFGISYGQPSQTHPKTNPSGQTEQSKNVAASLNSQESNTQTQNSDCWFLKWFKDPNFYIAIFTFFLMKFAYEQIKISRDTAQRQLRAYIVVKPSSGIIERTTNQTWQAFVNLEVRNTGQTPAYFVETESELKFFPEPLPENSDFTIMPTPGGSSATIGSNDTPIIPQCFLSNSMTSQEFHQKIIDTSQKLYFYGHVTYKDIFGATQTT